MPVPKKKVSKSRRNSRRAHHALTAPQLVSCTNCETRRLPHSICEACGFYRGRFVPKQFLNKPSYSTVR